MKFSSNKLAEKDTGQTKRPIIFHSVGTWLAVLFVLLVLGNACLAQTQGGTVVAWDDNSIVQTNMPIGLSGAISLAANSYYTIAVKNDGSVAVWGQFYDDVISLPGGLNSIAAAAAGPNQSLAIKSDGTVIAWGDRYNSFGVQNVPAGLSNVVEVAATAYNSFALKSDGTITVWGTDAYGSAEIPVGLSNIVAIAARDYSGLALKCDGTVIAWGLFLQTNRPAGLTNIVAIDKSGNKSIALKSDGSVIAWANDNAGNVSQWTNGIPASLSNVVGVAVGGDVLADRYMAWKSDGTAVTWGSNPNPPSGLTNIVDMAANYSVYEAIVNDGSPLIFRQPFFNQTVFSGTTVFLNVGAAGQPYPAIQWQKNGTNLINATNCTFILNNVQQSDSGTYNATATNSISGLTSRSATLTVITSPPILTSQPPSQTCAVGADVTLSIGSDGSRPFFYQWQFNGTNLDSATNASLTLTNLQLVNAGAYDVTVSNIYGSITSSNAVLSVMDFAAALNTTNLTWTTSGNPSWFVTISSSKDGVSSAQAGDAVSNNVSTLTTTVVGPATLNFWWYLTVYNGLFPTTLTLTANGMPQMQTTGTTGYPGTKWVQQTCYLGTGTQTVAWVYNSAYPNTGYNTAGLDLVSVSPGGTAPIVISSTGNQTKLAGTNVMFNVSAAGTPPLYYQWYFNSNSVAGATNDSLMLTNVQSSAAGGYSVQVSNNFGVTNSTNSFLTINPSAPYLIRQPTNQWTIPGGAIVISPIIGGSAPLAYQWLFNGTSLPNATNATLTLNNAQASDGGKYSLLITNDYGAITSSIAILTVSTVVAWDVNNYGQATVPYNLGSASAIAGSQYNSLAVLTNGTIAAWGLGNTGSTNVPANLTNVVRAAFSDSLGLAIENDGTVGWWGTSTQTNPIPYLSNVTAVAASQGNFYMALQTNGMVTAWGANSYHQTNVPAGLSNVVAVAVGDYHSLALKCDGTVSVWGGNLVGSSAQTNIPAGLSNIVVIAGGNSYSLAVNQNGSVVGWPTNEPNVVMRIPTGLSNAVSVAADYQHALALTKDGIVWEWGTVGTGYLTNQIAFSNAIGTAVACGYYHSLANLGSGLPVVIQQPWNQSYYGGYSTFMYAGVVGAPPTTYQWQLNGTNVNGATNLLMSLNNITPANAGSYTLIASNSQGIAVSSNATLTVITYPPILTLQPTSQTVIAGSNVTFSVAIGAGPIPNTLQWQFNGTNIVGATNLSLSLTNVQTTNQGNYAVVVNNGYGTTTSSNAYLTVIVIDLPTALNTPGWTWTNSGSTAWYAQTNTTHDGFEAAQSGLVVNGQSSTLQTTVTGPGTLTFWWMFSPLTSPFPNTLSFSSSLGNASTSVNSTTGWQQKTIYLGAGQQTLNWNYSRYSIFSAQSTGWVDQVSFTPGGTLPALTSMSPNAFVRVGANVTFSVGAYGTPPLSYQWQLNGTNLLNKTNTFLSLTGVQVTNTGLYSVMITNSFGSATTNVALWVGQFALNSSATNFVFSTNGLQLQLDGILTTNQVVIFGSTDLVSWLPLFTNSATTGSIQFLDVTATNLPTRFYRAQE